LKFFAANPEQNIDFRVIPLNFESKPMDNRKIKLALTVGILNQTGQGNTLQLVRRLMNKFRTEVGEFLGLRQLEDQVLNRSHTLQSFALDFEHYTLNLDIVNNRTDNTESINRLEFSTPTSMIAA
jgi:hypothetical protein